MVTSPWAMVVTDGDYRVTGTLDPDATGNYVDAGEFNGKRSYELTPDGWFIWWDTEGWWTISVTRGLVGFSFWTREDPEIQGLYSPGGTATGDATVTEI